MTDVTQGYYAKTLIHYVKYIRGYYTQNEIDALKLFREYGWDAETAAKYVLEKIYVNQNPMHNLVVYLMIRNKLKDPKQR